jgi:hypothetical protein
MRDYQEALRAFDDDKYTDAVDKLEQAISEKPTESERERIGGMRYDRYLPQFQLGRAKHALGDCEGAVRAWEESLRQGVVQNFEEHDELLSGMGQCQGQVIDVSAIAQAAERSISDLESTTGELSGVANAPDWSGDEETKWLDELNTTESTIASLRRRLERAVSEKNAEEIESITTEAGSFESGVRQSVVLAEVRLQEIRDEEARRQEELTEEARLEQLAAAAAEEERKRQEALEEERRLAAIQEREEAEKRRIAIEQRRRIADAQGGLRAELESAAPSIAKTQGNERVRQARGALAELSAAGEAMSDSNSIDELNRQAQAIRDGVRLYSQAVQEWEAEQVELALRTPPPELQEIAEAYFSGQYESVSSIAEPSQFSESRHRIQTYLFRSAATFNLYILSGGSNPELLDRARDDIEQIKELDSGFSPYVAAFSPRYLQFFTDPDAQGIRTGTGR